MKKRILISLVAFTIAYTQTLYASVSTTDYTTFVTIDALYWQAREGGADMWGERIGPEGSANPTVDLLEAPFDWNTGYRIGGGYRNISGWDTVAYFTSYHTKATNQIYAPSQVYSPYIGNFFQNNLNGGDNGPYYDAASILWRFAYDTVDLELGRTFKFDKLLTLRPFLGLKGAIINQNIYTTWQGPHTRTGGTPVPITTFSVANENLTNYFSGIGPSFGVDTTWPIYEDATSSFSVIGNFSAALMWGLWRYKDLYQTNGSDSVTVTTGNVNGAAPVITGFVGLGWKGQFPKVGVAVRLGYEGQVWFNQVQFNMLSSGRLNDNMSLQGGVLDVGINF